ncbi:MAG: glucosamine-6-phosphate deaminase, partial [Ignavibacteriales bacterium]|nr:glucosamine-6-phosphate deaminase [Ignavibacteriales bacterium]
MNPKKYDGTSTVEDRELRRSGRQPMYAPTEKIRILEVDNFPLLGKVAAFRFVEWVLKNPGGVVSLPTGKTPEFFINWVQRILGRWEKKEIQAMLAEYGIGGANKPDMRSLSFVQIDEFYPMDANQRNSFNWYVREFYIKGFGLDPAKALLIDATSLGLPPGKTMEEIFPDNLVDLSLRVRQTRTESERLQKETINRVDWFCTEYERKIRELGGIGFFLGGIGPDGHIAFNVRGSSFYSVTRLTGTNYETQAAAATDLGGIEISRSRLVITIGLSSITYNLNATAIIIAAGDAKASIVRMAVEEHQNPQYPASSLHELPNARFYLSRGAASLLTERKFVDFKMAASIDAIQSDEIVIQLALRKEKKLDDLVEKDFTGDRFAAELMSKSGASARDLALATKQRMMKKIEKGVEHVGKKTFLHTEPHHDDIMLAYLPYLYHLVRDPENRHYFA